MKKHSLLIFIVLFAGLHFFANAQAPYRNGIGAPDSAGTSSR